MYIHLQSSNDMKAGMGKIKADILHQSGMDILPPT